MDKTQSFLKKKKRSFIIITSITLVLVLIVAVLGVKIAYNIPWNYDMTATRLFTLSEQSLTVIDSLTEPVQIGAVYSAGTEEMMVESLLETNRIAPVICCSPLKVFCPSEEVANSESLLMSL